MAKTNTIISIRDKKFSKEEIAALEEIRKRGPMNKARNRRKFCENYGRDINEVNAYFNPTKRGRPAKKNKPILDKSGSMRWSEKNVPGRKSAELRKDQIRVTFKRITVEGNVMIFEI